MQKIRDEIEKGIKVYKRKREIEKEIEEEIKNKIKVINGEIQKALKEVNRAIKDKQKLSEIIEEIKNEEMPGIKDEVV